MGDKGWEGARRKGMNKKLDKGTEGMNRKRGGGVNGYIGWRQLEKIAKIYQKTIFIGKICMYEIVRSILYWVKY